MSENTTHCGYCDEPFQQSWGVRTYVVFDDGSEADMYTVCLRHIIGGEGEPAVMDCNGILYEDDSLWLDHIEPLPHDLRS